VIAMTDDLDIPGFLDRRTKRPAPTLEPVPVDISVAEPLIDIASSPADIRNALLNGMQRLVNGEIEPKTANAIADRAADNLNSMAEAVKAGARMRRSRPKEPVTIDLMAEPEPPAPLAPLQRPFHPLCELFPAIEGAAFDDLVASIQENGLQEPITVIGDDEAILDGRNRYNACLAAGVEPVFTPFRGDDPVRFVLAANVRRRHLNESQRALIAAKLATLGLGSNQHQKEDAPIGAPSQETAAEMLSVGRRSVQRARQVLEHAEPADIKAIAEGKATVSGIVKKRHPTTSEPEPEFAVVGCLQKRFGRIVAEGRAHLQFINAHAAHINEQIEPEADEAAKIWHDIRQRVRTLAAANRAERRAGPKIIKLESSRTDD
jgi:hypothetical protein